MIQVGGLRVCEACGAALPLQRTGRPAVFCHPDTGRPCREWARIRGKLLNLSHKILEKSDNRPRVKGKVGGQIQRMGADLRYQA